MLELACKWFVRRAYQYSFPTRRSSDLQHHRKRRRRCRTDRYRRGTEQRRSEEHTSELQSQSNLVCRLLLEKKKILHIVKAWISAPQVLVLPGQDNSLACVQACPRPLHL